MAITISGDSPNFTSVAATTVNGVTTLNSSSGVLATQNGMTGIAKAWVNFDGTGTPSIRSSFNVSSITDNGTGDYTVNFTTAMPNANYAFVGTASSWAPNTNTTTVVVAGDRTTARTASAFRVFTRYGNSDIVVDPDVVNIAVFSS